ncbi:MAG: CinA family protein [Proteobacteria bacterium]|nr:CinA family protein [Pseudomonadota bacterium]
MTQIPSTEVHTLLQAFAGQMTDRGLRLATAESCTGGLLAKWMTTLPGSSNWFECGFVTYSNTSKVNMLQVAPQALEIHGAVSPQVAEQMASGALGLSGVDLAVSVTGIAGPDGGTASKPVGTVYIGIARREQPVVTAHRVFEGDRDTVREQSAHLALKLLVEHCPGG